jgi:nucleoside triphosphate pyrophosphatase
VIALALAKARAVAAEVAPGPALILGADTEVVLDGRLLGKPEDSAHAVRMLQTLRGRVHEVVTGLALVEAASGREETLSVTSRVRMGSYSDADVETYVATGEPFDKAGGYAVQGAGGRLVAEVDGCLTNVVGLPVETTRRLLGRWGIRSPAPPDRPNAS